MLFNSLAFLFVFLPFALLVYTLTWDRLGRYAAHFVLLLLSAAFYGWWSVSHLLLLLALLLLNYWLGEQLRKPLMASENGVKTPGAVQGLSRKSWLCLGLAINLGVLVFFKYSNFLLDNLSRLTGGQWHVLSVVLPLGISFYIFQKIAYLVDCYQGRVRQSRLADFALFVLFFPQLIAGPIVHHRYFFRHLRRRLGAARLALFWCGLVLLLLGLFKKVVLADSFALIAEPGFAHPEPGWTLWLSVLAFTLQIYFDFSGYSDMAIGLAGLFGLRLPLNFASPYRSTSVIEFWRRWHITLSSFLRDYLYIPLGGNRDGRLKRQRNLLLTMLIGGFWHGASWNFILWGGLHGLYLAFNHGWRASGGLHRWWQRIPGHFLLGWLLTMVLVSWAWVPFRAPDLETTLSIWRALLQGPGWELAWPVLDRHLLPDWLDIKDNTHLLWIMAGFTIALALPNSQTLVGYRQDGPLPAMPTPWLVFSATVLGVLALKAIIGDVPSVFLYFNF